MKTLFLNLASHEGLIACVADDRIVASIDIHPRSNDREFHEAYESVLKKADWKDRNIERIACVTGPGGFTSLRTAVVFTNALQYALNIPAAGIHLSDLKKNQIQESDAWWLHSTKKDLMFARGFGRYAEMQPEPEVKTLEEIKILLHAEERYFAELIPEHQAMIDAMGLMRAEERSQAETFPECLRMLIYSSAHIVPWYGRQA